MEQEAAFEGEQTVDGDEPPAEDVSMTDLVLDHNLDMPFSYGGSTISSAELSVSLQCTQLGRVLLGKKDCKPTHSVNVLQVV